MTKREQIEEMAKILRNIRVSQGYTSFKCDISCENCPSKQYYCVEYKYVEALYNAGYRKIDDNCAVITKAELKQYKVQAVKEFAEKLKELLHDDYIMPSGITDERCVFEGIDELLKENEE